MHVSMARGSTVHDGGPPDNRIGQEIGWGRRPYRAAVCLLIVMASAIAAIAVECVQPDPAVRYIAFGDSATAGATSPAYPEWLRRRLNEDVGTFVNAGDDGEPSEEGVARLDGLLSRDLYPNAKALLYWEGGIDVVEFIRTHDPLFLLSPDDADYPFTAALDAALDATQANIESAIRLGQDAGLTVFVATYFAIPETIIACDALLLNVLLPAQARWSNAYVRRLNDRIRAAAMARGAVLVDLADTNAAMQADESNYVDCNHLSSQGNDIVAGVFADAISASGM